MRSGTAACRRGTPSTKWCRDSGASVEGIERVWIRSPRVVPGRIARLVRTRGGAIRGNKRPGLFSMPPATLRTATCLPRRTSTHKSRTRAVSATRVLRSLSGVIGRVLMAPDLRRSLGGAPSSFGLPPVSTFQRLGVADDRETRGTGPRMANEIRFPSNCRLSAWSHIPMGVVLLAGKVSAG